MTATVTPISAAPRKKRSNRDITAFACQRLEWLFNKNPLDNYQFEEKNTTVQHVVDGNLRVIKVLLYGEEIIRLTLSGKCPLTLSVSFTSTFDSSGQPTTTTCERLNGLLDCLGYLRVIPMDVRVFRGDFSVTYFGRGSEKVAVGRDFFGTVYVRPSRERLVFAGFVANTSKGGA
jgi:hypothetical protein